MRILRIGLSTCVSVLFCISLAGQGTTATQPATTGAAPPQRDPQAVVLLQRALVVLTGGTAITDVTLTGSARRVAGSDDETGTATLRATTAGDSRVDLSFPSGERSEIRNHAATPLPGSLPADMPAAVAQAPQLVGVWSGPDSASHPVSGHNLMTDPAWFFPALTLANLLASQTYSLSYVGQETQDGQPVLHVVASRPLPVSAPAAAATLIQHLTQMDLYFDPETLLPVALAFNTHPDNAANIDLPVQIRFSDYQVVRGVKLPLHLQKFLNNTLVLDVQLSDATFNSGPAASTFAIQ